MTSAVLREHYEVEVELANRLRSAPAEERRGGLYAAIYRERLERIPTHPLLVRAGDATAREGSARAQLKLLAPWVNADSVFMEVGPGDCALALAVATRAKKVYAVDVTDALLGDVQQPPNFHLVTSNGVTVPVPPATVDIAYSNQVLEHLHPGDAEEHIRAIYAALVPGGRFICITPNRLSGPWDVSREFDDVACGLHLREYTVSEAVDLVRSVGFTVTLLVSYKGRRLLRALPDAPVRVLERLIEPLPARLRRPVASPLGAVKVFATKPRTRSGEGAPSR